jgi:hypothetical protein
VYSEQHRSDKPFKVCPEVVTAKDTPCSVLGPTAAITQRKTIKEDTRDKEIVDLKEKVKQLEQIIEQLEKQNATK